MKLEIGFGFVDFGFGFVLDFNIITVIIISIITEFLFDLILLTELAFVTACRIRTCNKYEG
jgi:hypothetical protein